MATQMHGSGSSPAVPDRVSGVHLGGWAIFGGITLVVVGVGNILQGITALSYEDFLTAELIYENLEFWGWLFLIWGALQAVAGGMTLAGSESGPVSGMVLAGISAVFWFFMIFAAPAPAIVGIALSIAVVAALSSAYGD